MTKGITYINIPGKIPEEEVVSIVRNAFFDAHVYSHTNVEADPDAYSIDEQRTFYALYGGSLAGCGRKEEGEAMIRKAEAMGYGNGNRIREIAGLPV